MSIYGIQKGDLQSARRGKYCQVKMTALMHICIHKRTSATALICREDLIASHKRRFNTQTMGRQRHSDFS